MAARDRAGGSALSMGVLELDTGVWITGAQLSRQGLQSLDPTTVVLLPYLQAVWQERECEVLAAGGDEELARAVVRRAHAQAGHVGVNNTIQALALRSSFYLYGAELIVDEVARCRQCAERKGGVAQWVPAQLMQAEGQARLVPASFNDIVHVDIVGPLQVAGGQSKWLLTVICELTRWCAAVIIDDQRADTVAQAFHHAWFSQWGAPRYIVTDRGGCFTGDVWHALWERCGSTIAHTTAYHPASNGLVERLHRSLADFMYGALRQRGLGQADWPFVLDSVLLSLRSLVNATTGLSPAEAVLGFPLVVGDYLLTSPVARRLVDKDVLRLREAVTTPAKRGEAERRALSAAWKQRQDLWQRQLESWQERIMKLHQDGALGAPAAQPDAATRTLALKEGDYVDVAVAKLARYHDALIINPKLAERWHGPWRVSHTVRGAAVVLTHARDPLHVVTVTIQHVKRCVLAPDVRDRYEACFEQTMAAKKEELRQRQVVTEPMSWAPLVAHRPEQQWQVDRILGTKVVAGRRHVRVQWEGGEVTEEPLERFAVDMPDEWAQWCRQHSRKRRNVELVAVLSAVRKLRGRGVSFGAVHSQSFHPRSAPTKITRFLLEKEEGG